MNVEIEVTSYLGIQEVSRMLKTSSVSKKRNLMKMAKKLKKRIQNWKKEKRNPSKGIFQIQRFTQNM
jgi:hypothetical protein